MPTRNRSSKSSPNAPQSMIEEDSRTTREIEALRTQIEELKGIAREASRLRRDAKQKDRQVEILGRDRERTQAEIEDRDARSRSLEADLDRARRELGEANAQSSRFDDEALASALHSVRRIETENARLRAELVARAATQPAPETARPDATAGTLEQTLVATQRIVAARDDEIAGLRATLNAAQETLAARDQEIDAIETIRHLEEQKLMERDRETTQLRAQLSALGERIAARDAEAQTHTFREREIARLREVLESIRATSAQAIGSEARTEETHGEPERRRTAVPIESFDEPSPAAVVAAPELPDAVEFDRDVAEAAADLTADLVADPAPLAAGDLTELEVPIPPSWREPASQQPAKRGPLQWIRRQVSPAEPIEPREREFPAADPEPQVEPTPQIEPISRLDEAPSTPEIQRYWRSEEIQSKLAWPDVDDYDDFFLHYLFERCRNRPDRIQQIASVGTGSRDFEVLLARRALDAGVENFEIQCISPNASTLRDPQAIAVEPTVSGHLTVSQNELARWNPTQPLDLFFANQTLHHHHEIESAVSRVSATLAADGRFVVCGPMARLDTIASPVAREIVDQIWPLMPDRYKYNRELETLTSRYATHSRPTRPEDRRAPQILPTLLQHFHFEVFIAFGNVINAFVDDEIGPNFEAGNERDRSFIDRVASLDNAKIDAGLLNPTQLLAALSTEPVEQPRIYRHWTPEFCLGRAQRTESEIDGARVTPITSVPGGAN